MKPNQYRSYLIALSGFALSAVAISCGSSGIEGTYSNGSVVLDIRSGGKAQLTMLGDVEQCTWKEGDHKLTLTCKGDSVNFVQHDDGSLGGPMFVGNLVKSK